MHKLSINGVISDIITLTHVVTFPQNKNKTFQNRPMKKLSSNFGNFLHKYEKITNITP